IAEPIGQCLNERGAVPAASSCKRFFYSVAHGDCVIPIDLDSRYAGGNGFLRQRAGGRLTLDRYGDGPTIVDNNEHGGQGARAGNIDSFVERALRGAAVTDVGYGAALLAADLHR